MKKVILLWFTDYDGDQDQDESKHVVGDHKKDDGGDKHDQNEDSDVDLMAMIRMIMRATILMMKRRIVALISMILRATMDNGDDFERYHVLAEGVGVIIWW